MKPIKIISKIDLDGAFNITKGKQYKVEHLEVYGDGYGCVGVYDDNGYYIHLYFNEIEIPFKNKHKRWRKIYKAMGFKKEKDWFINMESYISKDGSFRSVETSKDRNEWMMKQLEAYKTVQKMKDRHNRIVKDAKFLGYSYNYNDSTVHVWLFKFENGIHEEINTLNYYRVEDIIGSKIILDEKGYFKVVTK